MIYNNHNININNNNIPYSNNNINSILYDNNNNDI